MNRARHNIIISRRIYEYRKRFFFFSLAESGITANALARFVDARTTITERRRDSNASLGAVPAGRVVRTCVRHDRRRGARQPRDARVDHALVRRKRTRNRRRRVFPRGPSVHQLERRVQNGDFTGLILTRPI